MKKTREAVRSVLGDLTELRSEEPSGKQLAESLAAELADYIEAVKEEESAKDRYDGYSWDYHGWTFIERRQKAAERFTTALEAVIDARIAKGHQHG